MRKNHQILGSRCVNLKKIVSILCIFIVMVAGLSISVSAAPTDSYTHLDQPGNRLTPVLTREMYTAVQTITATSVGMEKPFEGLTDICCDKDGTVYVLCGKNSRLIMLNKDYTLKTELFITDENGANVNFTGAEGIYVDENNLIYITDTENGRIIIVNQSGQIREIWKAPKSSLIPEDFIYKPISIVKDNKGYSYILSLGCYYGALSYSPDGEFLGFYGANTVKAGALDTLEFLWDKLTSNDTKRSLTTKKLPFSFADFSLDADGYLVTCTGKTGKVGLGQIRKISPNGSNILTKRNPNGDAVSSSDINFMESISPSDENQNMVSIDVDDNGFMFALDAETGTVYVYDSGCNLLNGFGGGIQKGIQLGVFKQPVSLTLHNSSILVADRAKCSITVFKITDYGNLLQKSVAMYAKGDYKEAKPLWEQVLAEDSGCQYAYRGLAMASYIECDYKAALNYAKNGLDYTVYELAWQAVLADFMAKNFIWIFIIMLILLGGLITLFVYVKKHKIILIKNSKVKTLAAVPFHPFSSFEVIKYKKQGSLVAAFILMLLLYIAFALKKLASGFLFNDTVFQNYNVLYTLAQTAGLLLLWSLSNWLVCSLFSGKGKLSEVFIASAYTLLPIIIFTFIRVILSHFLPLSGLQLLDGIETAIWIFTFFLLCIAMMAIHEYDFFKLILTSAAVIFLMLIIVFLLFMAATLFKQFYDFIYNIYNELAYR